MNEMWRPVVGYEKLYEVSSLGRVKNMKGREITVTYRGPYPQVALWKNGVLLHRRVHIVVASAFLGPAVGRDVNHEDRNKRNYAADNLVYMTRSQNIEHGWVGRGQKVLRSDGTLFSSTFKAAKALGLKSAGNLYRALKTGTKYYGFGFSYAS